ncbi:hypothetical protein TNCV_4612551 [Trichonephila clavipes]|nr:hypothetical protein TNCV_4612551 [Trichonephila clavipes]
MFLNIIELKSNNCYRHTRLKNKTVNIELDIALTDEEPIFHKPRRLPFAERDIVDAQVDEWLKIELLSRVHPLTLIVANEAFEWHQRFKDARESVEGDEHSGRPQTSRTTVKRFLRKNRLQRRAEEVGIFSAHVNGY